MKINNLELNILYFICNPLNGQLQDGTVDQAGIYEEFSDIPEGSLSAAIDSMETDGLISTDRPGSRISITENGLNRLQASIACHGLTVDSCDCATGRPMQGRYTGDHP